MKNSVDGCVYTQVCVILTWRRGFVKRTMGRKSLLCLLLFMQNQGIESRCLCLTYWRVFARIIDQTDYDYLGGITG